MEKNRRWFRGALIAVMAAALSWASTAQAQAYPTRPMRLIVPAPPGGGTDILGRIVADGITKQLGQAVVVENRGGGSGMIAAELVLQAPSDGYTLFMVYSGVLTVNLALYKQIKYDPINDFAPVAIFADVPNLLIVRSDFQAKSVGELIDLAKSNPGKLNYASSGNGVANHLSMELFKQMAGIDLVHVPYKGGAPAMIDLAGGQVQLMFNNMVEALPHVKSGRMRALAIATAKRSPMVPDIPTVSESGLSGYETSLWYGVVAAAGTPASIVEKLNAAIRATQQQPEVIAKLAAMGADPVSLTPQEFAEMIKREADKWGRVVREAGIRVD